MKKFMIGMLLIAAFGTTLVSCRDTKRADDVEDVVDDVEDAMDDATEEVEDALDDAS